MQKPLLLFVIILFSVFLKNLDAQPQFYTEQNSGVTSSLTSVSMDNSTPSRVWVCGNGGVVLKTTNSGTNWLNVSSGIPNSLNLVTISSKAVDTVLTAGNVGTTTYVYRTQNGGANWTQVFTQANGHINAIWMTSMPQGFMVGNPVSGRWSIWKTNNSGLNWDSTGLYITQAGSETGWNNSLAIIYNNIWFGTNNSRIYKSSNFGTSWTYATTPEQKSTAVWINLDTTMYTFAYTGGNNAYYTTSGGVNWTQISCPDTGIFKAFSPITPGVDYLPPWISIAIRDNSKVYYSGNGTSPFTVDYTAPSGIFNHMAYNRVTYPLYTWAVRSNGGITKIQLFRGGAVRRISSEIPEHFNLHQNYPNPFNPSTKIKFSLPLPSQGGAQAVKLVIYDIIGREVAILVNEQLNPGSYEVEWDGSNYPSGVYFYKLITGDYSETKKMVMLR